MKLKVRVRTLIRVRVRTLIRVRVISQQQAKVQDTALLEVCLHTQTAHAYAHKNSTAQFQQKQSRLVRSGKGLG